MRDKFYRGPSYIAFHPRWLEHYKSPTAIAGIWLWAWSLRMFSIPGRILFLCTLLLVLYSMVSLHMASHILTLFMLSLFGCDTVIGFFLRPRLQCSRIIPSRVTAGGRIKVEYLVRNVGRRTAYAVSLDTLPWPSGLQFSGGRPFFSALPPSESRRFSTWVRGLKRGRYLLPTLRAHTGLPFNLTLWGSMCPASKVVHVIPDFTPLTELAVSGTARHQPGGIALSSQVAENMEFFGCREYRDGDNPRHIHWPSWARTGYPVVKEFREEYFCRTAVVLDTFLPPPWWALRSQQRETPNFEAAISLTAAIADYLTNRDYVIDLFAALPKVYRFQGGRSLGEINQILDILACAQPQRRDGFTDIGPEIMPEISQITSCLFILQRWNEKRQELIEKAIGAGVATRIFLIGQRPPSPAVPQLTLLHPQDILEGRCLQL